MPKKLFVGGLPYSATEKELNDLFAEVGSVESVQLIIDRSTNQSKGFGFVQMATDDDTAAAIKQLNGKDVGGRSIIVNEARPMEDRPRRDFGGGGGYGNRDGGGGGGGGGRSY